MLQHLAIMHILRGLALVRRQHFARVAQLADQFVSSKPKERARTKSHEKRKVRC